jgi:hypothetical protein
LLISAKSEIKHQKLQIIKKLPAATYMQKLINYLIFTTFALLLKIQAAGYGKETDPLRITGNNAIY